MVSASTELSVVVVVTFEDALLSEVIPLVVDSVELVSAGVTAGGGSVTNDMKLDDVDADVDVEISEFVDEDSVLLSMNVDVYELFITC